MSTFSLVVPTVGRPSLATLLHSLETSRGPHPERVVVVDDRPSSSAPLDLPLRGWLPARLLVEHSRGRGPAAARNRGWWETDTEWVVFLDDDVEVSTDWFDHLAVDLDVARDTVASQGRIEVPLPRHRRPTDWERATLGLATARWITADLAVRRTALERVDGFDERFPRAFREDADLALRLLNRGDHLVRGGRLTRHPVRPAAWTASIRAQRGNADDALMSRLHGRDWHERARAPRGRIRSHTLTATALAAAATCAGLRRHRPADVAALAWLMGTARFAWERIAPGPRDAAEVSAMLATSVVIPPLATWYRARGWWRHRRAAPWAPPIEAVLFDRDGTLVHDVPYNGDAALVRPLDGARQALDRLRRHGVRVGVVTNQSGVARGLIDLPAVHRVNARVADLLGPFGTVQVCPHDDPDGCTCRKPQPGMILAAAAALGVPAHRCAVVGDTAADLAAGAAAGVGACVLVPNRATRPQEIRAARLHADDLAAAVTLLLHRRAR